jgi:hypothetical protein
MLVECTESGCTKSYGSTNLQLINVDNGKERRPKAKPPILLKRPLRKIIYLVAADVAKKWLCR